MLFHRSNQNAFFPQTAILPGSVIDHLLIEIQAYGIAGWEPWHHPGDLPPTGAKLRMDMIG
jgi:hypothetical protein